MGIEPRGDVGGITITRRDVRQQSTRGDSFAGRSFRIVGTSSSQTFRSRDDVSDEGAGAVGIEPRGDVGGITITRHDVGQRSTGGDAFAGRSFRIVGASSLRTFRSRDDVSDEGVDEDVDATDGLLRETEEADPIGPCQTGFFL